MPKIYDCPHGEDLEKILTRPLIDSSKLDAIVSGVLKEIEAEGDVAVRRYTSKFDGVDVENVQVVPCSSCTRWPHVCRTSVCVAAGSNSRTAPRRAQHRR